eukprot:TRINITY_DN5354_c0_g1_i1.p1 TRINITY_DN5354_c0_g1~~TRINITY_DN5354_c0_g1_i1.p1  ORF type:complete len:268 (+),score=48.13 TRINITY_DN5354_c0_g1_i1:42-845(+)
MLRAISPRIVVFALFRRTAATSAIAGDSSVAQLRKNSPEANLASFQEDVQQASRMIRAASIRGFEETLDLTLNLAVEKAKSHEVRGLLQLPFGTGKKVRIAVFARGENAVKARENGADIVGSDDLVDQIQKGSFDFDKCLATPDMMPVVSKVARILGPRGLMPNPKFGTVTTNIVSAIQAARAGQLQYRADRDCVLQLPTGKVNFPVEQLWVNIRTVFEHLVRTRPLAKKGKPAKGNYFKSGFLSSTMGHAIQLDMAKLELGLKQAK